MDAQNISVSQDCIWQSHAFPSPPSLYTHQVIDAQEEGLDAPIALAIPAGRDAQIYPHQLGQELQGEASQEVFRAPVQLEQLVAHRLQQLDWQREWHHATNELSCFNKIIQ